MSISTISQGMGCAERNLPTTRKKAVGQMKRKKHPKVDITPFRDRPGDAAVRSKRYLFFHKLGLKLLKKSSLGLIIIIFVLFFSYYRITPLLPIPSIVTLIIFAIGVILVLVAYIKKWR